MKNDQHDIKSDEQSLADSHYTGISWVGMSKIQSFIIEEDRQVPAELDLFVNLLAGHRGIHMSRLYQLQMESLLGKKITALQIKDILMRSIVSQDGISTQARMKISYQSLLDTKSLKSNMNGFRSYPVEINAEVDGKGEFRLTTKFILTYSSTCPQSAKLSKEFFKDNHLTPVELQQWYESEQIFPATPHAQRSHMTIELVVKEDSALNISDWIQQIESCLQTNVQTAVKKADEMEFARLNAAHTMFCEDAVRKVAHFLDSNSSLSGYRLTADHLESLHPHNATSQLIKNYLL
jgi:GTP cyclohydrolase I